ncbi:Uncharacterised protein [Coprococcus eutactus]|nr:Uncharacterised protein [Coprococcus eutactus]
MSKIYDTLGQYIDDIRRQRDIIYISKMAESLDISSLDRYRAQLTDEYERLGTLKKILDEAYDLYKECNEKFEASGQTLCNLYAETPWYETSEGKLAIGIGVLVVTAAVAIVCPAVLEATAAAVTQSVATSALVGSAISGIMNGAASVKAGKSFFDGFASGVEEGAIIGALCGMFGAGTAVMMTGAEMTVGNVFAARVINAVGDATIGTATYIYHENKYDKAITGGDVAKAWAECAITSFVLRSVFEGGKSSSKADGKNRVMSTSKGRVESERSITCEGGRYSNLGNMSFEDGKQYSSWSKLREEGLSLEQVEKIKGTPKGQKPLPETYLSEEYINNHLNSFKKSGAVKIMPSEPSGTIGGKGGTFVMSGDELSEIIRNADGDVAKIESVLGLDKGYLGSNPVIVTIQDTSSLRLPSGNELGAWPEYWEPGGYTSGGIKEAVINPAKEGTYTYKHLFE